MSVNYEYGYEVYSMYEDCYAARLRSYVRSLPYVEP
jgi:hypothetical protein